MDRIKRIQSFDERIRAACPEIGDVEYGDAITIGFKESASKEQRDAALSIAAKWKTEPEPQIVPPLTDDEIRWVRDQMKAKVDAVR